jgi:MscS family membrane protein
VGLALGLVAFSTPLRAQAGTAAASQPAATKPAAGTDAEHQAQHAPEDPWNRGTPRGAMLGFLVAGREGRWEDAAHYLDLSHGLSPDSQASGPKLARHLKVLLDQKLWVDVGAISDQPAGDLADGLPERRERIGTFSLPQGSVDVLLDRVPREGDSVLIWKIAASTVTRIPALYAQIGYGPLIESLPRVLLDNHFLELALWQWIGQILLVILAWFGGWACARLVIRWLRPLTAKTETDIDDRLLELTASPLRLLAAIGIFHAALPLLHLPVPAETLLDEVSKFLVILAVAWLALRAIDLASLVTKERLVQRGRVGASNLVPLGARAIKIAVLVITVLACLDTFGVNVTAVLAGLGVGGLAVALAAQKTIENIFGGVSVLLDQPVRPGDFCRFGDKLGTVEDIGVRSTRIRTLDRTVISIPNAEFSTLQLENFAVRDRIRLINTIGLRYETKPDQMRHAIAGLRRVLLAHPKVLPEPQRVRFVGFGSSSLDLEVFAYVETTDFNEFLAIREDIFLRFMDVVAESGTGFAFPSTTTYLARDGGLDREKQARAEAQVAAWRSEGKLMFPSFTPAEVEAMDDTLDWPPKGSVQSAAGR